MSDGPQRRGAHVDEAVLAATLQLLATAGYDFTVEDVAAHARVHKTTVYRRWETKPLLVAAAVARLAEQTVVAGDTGDPLADLEDLAVQVAAALDGPAGRNPLRATLAAAASDPELADVARRFFHSRYETAVPFILRAQKTGLIAPEWDPETIWQAIVNPLHIDAICGIDVTPQRARTLLALVLDGARPRVRPLS
jgi:AcrR family transcriptional regulator